MSHNKLSYCDCCDCKYEHKDTFEEPCVNCQNNFVVGTEAYYEHKLLWESPLAQESNAVSHPSHYNQGGIECWDAMEAAYGKEAVKTFCKLNAFKYIWRAESKNGLEDINKAINYLTKFKELVDSE